ncbi:MAG: sensor histidine kinase, partial [Actinobacteria bacterium]|nr:sensor histidine kinase [Actinomycetota bacterium]
MNQPRVPLLSPRWSMVATVAGIAVLVVVILGQFVGGGNVRGEAIGLVAGIAVPFTVLGLLVLMSTPRHPVGRLMTTAGLAATVSLVGWSWGGFTPLIWLGQWPWWIGIGLVFLAILLFPDGRLPSPRWRPVAVVIVTGTAVAAVGFAVGAIDNPELLTNVRPLHRWAEIVGKITAAAALLTVLGYLGALWSLWSRWRRADAETRRQLMCLLPACLVLLIGMALEFYGVDGAWALVGAAVPLGMAVAILRYRLYDVDLVVNRTIVWFLMTALVVVGVTAIVQILSSALFDVSSGSAQLLSIGLAVVTFQPLHRRVQR